ncbi:MAG: hypothetical protein QOH56_657 [Pseudonocardiales bacterium]|nr:hypothetical protein [Pseudonocardiales bacterium]
MGSNPTATANERKVALLLGRPSFRYQCYGIWEEDPRDEGPTVPTATANDLVIISRFWGPRHGKTRVDHQKGRRSGGRRIGEQFIAETIEVDSVRSQQQLDRVWRSTAQA